MNAIAVIEVCAVPTIGSRVITNANRAAPEPAMYGTAGSRRPASNASHPTQSSIARKSPPVLTKSVNHRTCEC
jgi:hypothetical protein